MSLAEIMDALAGAVPDGIVTQAYGHPVGSVVPPAAVVGYPTAYEFDTVFVSGRARVVFPLWFVCSMVDDASAQDAISAVFDGADDIKLAIETDTTLRTLMQTVRVTDATFESISIGAVPMVAVRFDVEVYT